MEKADVIIIPESSQCKVADFGRGPETTTIMLVPRFVQTDSNIMETGEKKVCVKVIWVCSMGADCKNSHCFYAVASREAKKRRLELLEEEGIEATSIS